MKEHDWEQREHSRHIEQWHDERDQKEFLVAGIRTIARWANERDVVIGPAVATELLDLVDDCLKQIAKH